MGTSAIYEIETPINEYGIYNITDDDPYGPDSITWIYTDGFNTMIQGGAFRLPNGNTLITDSDDAFMFEVNIEHEIVWEYNYGTNNSFIARAQKYSMDYLNNGFPDYVLGDVNFDNTINIMDVLITSDMFTGHGYLPTPPADYNQDGSVDQTDIVLLLNQILY